MTKKPYIVSENIPAPKALAIMNEKITSLLVVAENDFKKAQTKIERNNSYTFSVTTRSLND